MNANLDPVFIIARRELRDQFRDWRIIFPIMGLAFAFPFLMNLAARQILDMIHSYGGAINAEMLLPFFMMIVGFFPISISLVIALESFVGEKERGSIEALLYSPVKDWQIYVGKLISSILSPLAASFLGILVYTLGLASQNTRLPDPDLFVLILVLTTVQAIMMVSGAVVVSSQATSVKAANLLSSIIILPAALLIQVESAIIFWGDYRILWVVIVGLAALAILLVRLGISHFQREELLGREIDVLNIKWGIKVFWQSFTGGANGIQSWYGKVVPQSVSKLRKSLAVTIGLSLIAVLAGLIYIRFFPVPGSVFGIQNDKAQLQDLFNAWDTFSLQPVIAIWWQNLRALLVGMALGALSIGVLGMLPLIGTMGIMGAVLGILALNGGNPLIYFMGFILPHGIIEIPAAILSSAAVLQTGVMMVSPGTGKTVSEVWIASLAEWTKIMLGIVIPLLMVAAAIEVWVTPRIAMMFLGN